MAEVLSVLAWTSLTGSPELWRWKKKHLNDSHLALIFSLSLSLWLDFVILVMQSYANAVLSSFEDPEKILEQAVLEMNDDLTKMRQATAQVSYNYF